MEYNYYIGYNSKICYQYGGHIMKFEKLSENKLRITLNISDLADKNIDYQSFMSNSIDTQKLFLDMLDKAEREVGFETKNYKIMIEALVTSKGDFVVTVTRYLPNESSDIPNKKKSLKIKRKYTSAIKNKLIYSFNSFEDFCLFCNSLDETIIKNINKISKNISLYLFKNTYFLLITDINANYKYTKAFTSELSEFSSYIHNSNVFEYRLREYGKVIIENHAIKTCVKYFG